MCSSDLLRCPFSALGLTAEAASTFTFPRLMGHQRAAWFLMASEWMDAETCEQMGLAMEVLPGDKLMPHVMEKAATLAALPLASLQKTKALMMDPIRQQMKDAVMAENSGLAELSGSRANIEAIKAFAEKRDPDFTGL